jgi:hypothetical protein
MGTTSAREMWDEQRDDPRASVDFQVQLRTAAGPQLGRARDLSVGGIGAIAGAPPGLGSMVNVVLEAERLGRIDTKAIVVRLGDTMGLRFTALSAEQAYALETYLNRMVGPRPIPEIPAT